MVDCSQWNMLRPLWCLSRRKARFLADVIFERAYFWSRLIWNFIRSVSVPILIPMTYFDRGLRVWYGASHLRIWSPVGWGPIACRRSGGNTSACGRSSYRSCARVRRKVVRPDPPPTPWLRPTVHARFSPWINTGHTHIICLCDLETVREHGVAEVYLRKPELHA